MGMQRNIRAPKGFFGMRGKKDYDQQVQEKRALLGIQQVWFCITLSVNLTLISSLSLFSITWMLCASEHGSLNRRLTTTTVIHPTCPSVHRFKAFSECAARSSATTTWVAPSATSEHRKASWECAVRRADPTHSTTKTSTIRSYSITTTTASTRSAHRTAFSACEAKSHRPIWCFVNPLASDKTEKTLIRMS